MKKKYQLSAQTPDNSFCRASFSETRRVAFAWNQPYTECAEQSFPHVGNISLTFFPNANNSYLVNTEGPEDAGANPGNSESITKQRIFEKLLRRFAEIRETPLCPELNPDVIVISDDQSFLFEAQNQRTLELLAMRCGLAIDCFKVPERIRVHPLRRREIIDELRAAGVTVSGDY